MNYLARPVFEFEVDWSERPDKQFLFDLRKLETGFGAGYFATLEEHVVQGYKFTVNCRNAAGVLALDDFFAALTGRLQGFWLPAPFEAVQVVTADDATHFFIADQNLRATFADHPDIYLLIQRAGESRACKIAAVAAASNGRERITLTAALATPATPADTVCRLHHVRLAADEEAGQFLREGTLQCEITVVELPHEYEAFETGESPIWLYELSCAVPLDRRWRFTSFAADVVSGNQLYTAFAMSHHSHMSSATIEAEALQVEAKFDAAHPFALFMPLPLPRPMTIQISKVTLADLETRELAFTGTVRSVSDDGETLTANCDAWVATLKRKAPGMLIGRDCAHVIYEPDTCRLERWKFETTGTVTALDMDVRPPTVTLDLDNPTSPRFSDWMSADWFAGGWIEHGIGSSFRMRGILGSADAGGLLLELNVPTNLEIGDRVTLIPDCGGQADRCKAFRNYDNFGGFPAVPDKNPSLKASAPVSQGGKK